MWKRAVLLDGHGTRDDMLEAFVVRIFTQPVVIIVLGRRRHVLHVDEDAEVGGEAHFSGSAP